MQVEVGLQARLPGIQFDPDPFVSARLFMPALRSLGKAFGGVQEIARQAELNAHTLYRTLSEQGNPELKTLMEATHRCHS